MNFDPKHFMTLATELDAEARQMKGLDEAGLREAKFRSAISRAYYAVFWRGRHYFARTTPSQPLPGFSAHYELRRTFDSYRGKSMRRIAKNMGELFAARRQADYEMNVANLESKSADMLTLANRLLNDIGNLPDDPTEAP